MLPPLPPEIWLEIFRIATLTPHLAYLHETSYHPFQATIPVNIREPLDSQTPFRAPPLEFEEPSFAVKVAISLVCKQWHALTRDLLYEDLVIPTNILDAHRLKNQVLRSGDSPDMNDGAIGGHERYCKVQRIFLSYLSTITGPNLRNIVDINDILRHHSSTLTALYRPRINGYANLAQNPILYTISAEDCPPLPNLKRLDWWHGDEAARTGGINSLADVLKMSPNVQYLSLGASHGSRATPGPQSVELLNLTTLRLQHTSPSFLSHILSWKLPSLRHLILAKIRVHYSSGLEAMDTVWEAFGAQLRTVELDQYLGYFAREGVIHNILTGCPNLEEINYYVLFASLPSRPHQPHTSLKTVRLHLANNEMISSSKSLAIIVETHLNAWCDPVYPNLRRVLLYGTVDLEDGPIRETVQRLRERGCEVAMVSGCDS